jgi:hypothetical protein
MCATLLFSKCFNGNGDIFIDVFSCRWRTCLREVLQNSMHRRICLRRKSCFCKCYVNLQRQSSETSTHLFQIETIGANISYASPTYNWKQEVMEFHWHRKLTSMEIFYSCLIYGLGSQFGEPQLLVNRTSIALD